MTEIIYGVRRTDGKIISIKEVPDNMSGLLCNCVCSNCGKELQACSLQGKVRPYFRHHNDSKTGESIQCNPNIANETALHQLAKQIIKEERKILLPRKEISILEAGINDISKKIENSIPRFVFQSSMTIYAQSVELEKHLGAFKPDVFIKTESEELSVEIFVSHRVNEDKKNKAREYGADMLEIDLSSFAETPVSSDELRDIILTSEKHKRWIYYPVSQECLVQAKSYYKNKIEEYSKRTIVKTQRTYESSFYTKRNNYNESYHSYSQRDRIREEDYPFYLEIKDRFNENHEQIIDSRGKRWFKCDYCGDKLLYGAFSKFNVDRNPNLGVCTMCCHRYKLFG